MKPQNRKPGNRGERRRADLIVLVALTALVLCSSCGQKGPPVLRRPSPPAVTDLRAELLGDELQLTWSLPKHGDRVFPGLEQFKLYRCVFRSAADRCADCPIPFREFLDVYVGDPWPARIEGDRVIFLDTMEADRFYAYKVVTYHQSGAASPDSNLAFWPELDAGGADAGLEPAAAGVVKKKND